MAMTNLKFSRSKNFLACYFPNFHDKNLVDRLPSMYEQTKSGIT